MNSILCRIGFFVVIIMITTCFSIPILEGAKSSGKKTGILESVEVTVNSPDSLELVGYVYLPPLEKYPNPPLVILLHQMKRDHSIWTGFTKRLCQDGFAVFAMDLRGHGYSIYEINRRKNRSPATFRPGDFERYPADVAQMVEKVCATFSDKIDTTRMAVIGASIGANTGLLFAEHEPRVKYTAMISPGIEYHGINIAGSIRSFSDRPLFLATAANDVYSAESCYLITDLSEDILELEVYKSYFHGNQLLNQTPELREKLRNDLLKYLGN